MTVHLAKWSDSEGLPFVLRRVPLLDRWERLLLDGGYDSAALIHRCEQLVGIRVELVRRDPTQVGFAVLPKRWMVERILAWVGQCRRLSKDDEHLPQTSERWIYRAMIHLMLKRLAQKRK